MHDPRSGFIELNHLVQSRSVFLLSILLYIKNAHFKRLCADIYFNNISHLNVVGCSGGLSVYSDLLRVASLVGDRSALDQAGYFQIFVKSHKISLK